MITILFIQIMTLLCHLNLIAFKHLFNNMFWVVSVGVLIAMIPNFITSLYLSEGAITVYLSQWLFSITGALVLTFLWYLLKDVSTK